MKRFQRKIWGLNIQLDISKDEFRGLDKPDYWDKGDKIKPYLEKLIICLECNPKLEEIIKSNSLKNMAILDAHCYSNEDPWTYKEKNLFGSKIRKVQDWINKNDGKYSLLIIACCNPENRGKVKSMSSTLAYASTDFFPFSTKFYDKDYLIISNPKAVSETK